MRFFLLKSFQIGVIMRLSFFVVAESKYSAPGVPVIKNLHLSLIKEKCIIMILFEYSFNFILTQKTFNIST